MEAAESFDIAIFGIGGHGRELAQLARRIHGADARLCFVVDQGELPASVNAVEVISLEAFLAHHLGVPVVVAVGDPAARRNVVAKLRSLGVPLIGLVHPSVELPPGLELGEGVIIAAGTHLTTNVEIGPHVHINLGCTVSHDVILREYCTISPGVHIAGYVTVGEAAFLGIGSCVINGSPDERITIGPGAVIGAGACVIGGVPANTCFVGVPARRL